MSADPKAIEILNEFAERRFHLEAMKQDIDTQYKADEARLKAAYGNRIAPLATRIAELDALIWQMVQTHRQDLVKPGKQSFAIASATFQFRKIKAKMVPIDTDGIMAAAKRLSLIRKIADPPVVKWTFNRQRFFAWLESHTDYLERFRPYMEITDESESLSVKPNTGHPVFHDKDRLTPQPFTIKKS